MAEAGNTMKQITFKAGIDYKNLNVAIVFTTPVSDLMMDAASARDLGENLIRLSGDLELASRMRMILNSMAAAAPDAQIIPVEVPSGEEN